MVISVIGKLNINSKKVALFFLFLSASFFGQTKKENIKTYEFTIYDGSESYTMHQFGQNYLSTYRVFSRTLDDLSKYKTINSLIKFTYVSLIGLPLTHEEGHRSILTSEGIGSVSQPFFNSKGAAYVKGVKDIELKNLRNNNLPNYARLHSAGLESDYALAYKMEELMAFEEESYKILQEEYFFRRFGIINYHLTTLIPSLFPDLKEEDNELKRDIVGHDIWGFARHLHRPNMPFFRYTQLDDLTAVEKRYVKNLAYKSFLNLLSPMLFGKVNFDMNTNLKVNFSLGHSLSPFGDYFEQNFFLFYKKRYKIAFYLREFMNKERTFFAGGVKLYNYQWSNKIFTSFGLDLWNQPKNLSFTTTEGKLGSNMYLKFNYSIFQKEATFVKGLGLFSELFYKTQGFLPEFSSIEEGFGFRLGISVSY